MSLNSFISNLLKKIKSLEGVLKEALLLLDKQDEELEKLEKENKELKNLFLKMQGKGEAVKKTSRNSNIPPSKDIARPKRTKIGRKKSGKKAGGQYGHKGHYLEMSPSPNKTKRYYPKRCEQCQKVLDKSLAQLDCSKQEIDIPPIEPVVTQYDRYSIVCSCGKCNVGKLPVHLTGKVQYGPRVRSMIIYGQVYQYIPFKRMQEMLGVCFGLHLSQGTVFNTLERTASKSADLYEDIRAYIEQSEVIGADETPIYVGGKKWYDWVWQNDKATFISCEDSRRKENIGKHFPNGFVNGALVSDRYAAHLKTTAKMHQMCWSHLLRKINYLKEQEDKDWAVELESIYYRAKHLETLKTSSKRGGKKTQKLEGDLNALLLRRIDKEQYPESARLCKSLKANREKILTFVYHPKVPSHNNASELAIRNAKVKMKISGCFKSAQQYYAIIRSIVDTMIKNNMPIFENLLKIEKGQAFSFAFN
jgi:transposase/archaellum component FlaC